MIQLKPFEAVHLDAVTRIESAIFSDCQRDSDKWRAGQQLDDPSKATRKYVAIEADHAQVVGYGAVRETDPDRYRLNLMVIPEWGRQGVGNAVFAKLEEDLVDMSAVSIQARVRSDQRGALAFAHRNGFSEVHRMEGMTLSVGDIDLTRFTPLSERLNRQEVVFVSLADEQRSESDWVSRLFDLHKMALESWPNDDPTRPNECLSKEVFADSIRDTVTQPKKLFLAKVGGAYVGYCGELGTAVHPGFRRRGIATALKVKFVNFAKKHGVEVLFTSSANPAIIAMNRNLGYRTQETEVRLIKSLVNL